MARIWNKHKQTNTPLKRKVIVGLSGGVDSAVAALFLKMQGFAVRAVFMLNWSESASGCHWEWDYESAKMAARHLDIPLELWNFEAVYRTEVYEPFIASLARGETPNPDVICNRHVKFGAFLEKARSEGADSAHDRVRSRADASSSPFAACTRGAAPRSRVPDR